MFSNKDYNFYKKSIYSVQIIFNVQKFRKNQFFSNIFTFLSVICQNFEDNLRILANFGKFSRQN